MLHEVFLALSGHPSPILDDTESFPHITPPETALLQSLGHLAALHRALRRQTTRVVAEHPSTICRAIANAVRSRHLARFQRAILDVERRILSSNSTHVGAHNTVPLASIVSDFSGWTRPLEWLWAIVCFMLPADHQGGASQHANRVGSGPATINKLRHECLTGFKDIEEVAIDLVKAAETAWLKQLSAFLMDSEHNTHDFFIQRTSTKKFTKMRVSKRNLPEFVTSQAALSVLHIGKASQYLGGGSDRTRHSDDQGMQSSTTDSSRFDPLRTLALLQTPLSSESFAAAIASIRTSLSQKLTTAILPSAQVVDTIQKLHSFFLLQRVEFADALVKEADDHIRNRHSQLQGQGNKNVVHVTSVTMREGELRSVLSKAWVSMPESLNADASTDAEVDWARDNLELHLANRSSEDDEDDDNELDDHDQQRYSVSESSNFVDFLLGMPAQLSLQLQPPLDLILTKANLKTYAAINCYLLAIRRAYVHLTALWSQAPLRKGAAFAAGPRSSYKTRMFSSEKLRKRFSERGEAMRLTWARCSRSIYLLLELGEYLISQVCGQSWKAFQAWLDNSQFEDKIQPEQDATVNSKDKQAPTSVHESEKRSTREGQNDPEIIAQGHQQYLAALYTELLLGQTDYTKALRTFLLRVDQFVAFINRLQTVQAKLDLGDEGVDDGFSEKYVREEHEVKAGLSSAGERLETAISQLTAALRGADNNNKTTAHQAARSYVAFEPWAGGSVDRLLMRLDLSTPTTAST